MKTPRSRRNLGVLLMTSSLAIGVLAPLAAFAAEAPEGDRVTVEAVQRLAFWNGRASETTPASVTTSFPPEAACLVAAQACSFPIEDDPTAGNDPTGGGLVPLIDPDKEPEPGIGAAYNALRDSINEKYTTGIEEAQGNDPGAPAEPVPDDTLPASVAFGKEYYRSAIEFTLPAVPAGDQIDSFIVIFPQGNPTFNNSSPALRQAVLATLTCATTDPEGNRCQQAEFEKVVTNSCAEGSTQPCLREDTPLVIQACPIGVDPLSGQDNVAWKAGGPYNEANLPATNCIAGGQGSMFTQGSDVFWAFDLTSALQSWKDGTIPYEGLLMTPGAAANFAFGDSETTFNKQLTLMAEATDIEFILETSTPPPPPPPFDGGGFGDAGGFGTTGDSGGFGFDDFSGSGGAFVSPPQPGANSPISVPAPETADGLGAESPSVAGGADVAIPAAVPTGSAWYMWLLLPIFLMGAYLMAQSLSEEVVLAAGRSGAMTRLLERRSIANAPDLIRG